MRTAACAVLLACLAILYSGASAFLPRLPDYCLYIAMALAIGVLVVGTPFSPRQLQSVAPYLGWLTLYFAWGVLVSTNRALVLPDVLRSVIRTGLIFAAILLVARRKESVRLIAGLLQAVIVFNFILAVIEFFHPGLTVTIGHALGRTNIAFSDQRPAGLWSNPNEAGFAYLFGLLLSHWIRAARVWISRISAVLGIYLTSSRGATYPLLLCLLIMAIYFARRVYRERRHQDFLANPPMVVRTVVGGASLVILGLGLVAIQLERSRQLDEKFGLARLSDLFEKLRNPGEPSHLGLAQFAIHRILTGPWYGRGVFTFQGTFGSAQGAHNIYLAVLGETGWIVGALYIAVLLIGLTSVFTRRIDSDDRLFLVLLWIAYLIIGFDWHNQFTNVAGIIYVCLLFYLPSAVSEADHRRDVGSLSDVTRSARRRLAPLGS